MPALIGVFAVGAYGYGAVLRGSDVLVNEVALVRGSPGATDGTAQVYIGVFSPSRGTYQVHVPGGALLSVADQRRLLRRRRLGIGARRPPGRSGQGPRPRGRVRLAPDDPRRDRGRGAAHPGRPAARSTGACRGPSRTPRRSSSRSRPSCWAGPSRSSSDLAAGAEATVDVAVGAGPVRRAALRQGRRAALLRGHGPALGGHDGQVHPPHDHRPADVRPELRLDRARSRPTARSSSRGAPGACCRSTSSGQKPRGHGQHPLLPPGRRRDQRQDHVPRRPAAIQHHRRRVPRSSARTRSASTSGRAAPPSPTGPSRSSGTFTPTELAMGMNFGGDMPIVAPAKTIEPLPSIPVACADPPTPDCVVARPRRPARGGAVRPGHRRLGPPAAPGRRRALRARGARRATSTRRPAASSSGSSTIGVTGWASASTSR